MGEAVCRDLGVDLVVVNVNDNPDFWQHLGYHDLASLDLRNQKERLGHLDVIWKNPYFNYI